MLNISLSAQIAQDDEIIIETENRNEIIKRKDYLEEKRENTKIIAFTKTLRNDIPTIIVTTELSTNYYIMPLQYRNLITAIMKISFLSENKAEVVFHCNPSNNLYAICDFKKNKMDYYYCSSFKYDLNINNIAYIREFQKNHFEIFINDQFVTTIENIGPVVILNIDNNILFIKVNNNQVKEIHF
jgi:hypothetical protein